MILSELKQGVITAINIKRYFGFLTTEEDGRIFWHGSALMYNIKELRVGNRVELYFIDTDKGKEAVAVRPLRDGQ